MSSSAHHAAESRTVGYADRQEATVRASVEAPVWTVGGELVPTEDFSTRTLPADLDTPVNPDAVAADAGRDRLDLTKNVGALEPAWDTADTIQAGMPTLQRVWAGGHQVVVQHNYTGEGGQAGRWPTGSWLLKAAMRWLGVTPSIPSRPE